MAMALAMDLANMFIIDTNNKQVVGKRLWEEVLSQLSLRERVQVEVKPYSKNRTVQQNRAYWGVWLKMLEDSTGKPAPVWHEYFKKMFIVPQVEVINNVVVELRKSTTDMTTKEFSEYIDKVQLYALEELGIEFPPLLYQE